MFTCSRVRQLNINTTRKTSKKNQMKKWWTYCLLTLMLHHLNQTDDSLPQGQEYDHHCSFGPKVSINSFALISFQLTPSNWMRNSVFSRRMASCSDSLRSVSKESTSSMEKKQWINWWWAKTIYEPIKIMEGCNSRAAANRARTSFSPSPT